MGQLSRLFASSGAAPHQAVEAEYSARVLRGGVRSLFGWIACPRGVDEHTGRHGADAAEEQLLCLLGELLESGDAPPEAGVTDLTEGAVEHAGMFGSTLRTLRVRRSESIVVRQRERQACGSVCGQVHGVSPRTVRMTSQIRGDITTHLAVSPNAGRGVVPGAAIMAE